MQRAQIKPWYRDVFRWIAVGIFIPAMLLAVTSLSSGIFRHPTTLLIWIPGYIVTGCHGYRALGLPPPRLRRWLWGIPMAVHGLWLAAALVVFFLDSTAIGSAAISLAVCWWLPATSFSCLGFALDRKPLTSDD